MPQEPIIAAIDLGTDKCVTLIAKLLPETRSLQVIGVNAVPSRGMKRSQIINLEEAIETISESLDGAERMAGLEIRSAWVSVGGAHIQSLNSKGVVAVTAADQEITQADVDRVIEAARAVSLPSDKEVIHVVPNTYKVDSQDGIKDPVGMAGIRLESEVHVVTAMSVALRNLRRALENLGLHCNGCVFSGLAASEAVLTETEKELGVCLVDIGAGTTSLSVYSDGSLMFSGSIPVGARLITQDIAQGCKLSMEVAEKIKLSLSGDTFRTLKPQTGESKQDFNARKRRAEELKLEDFTNGEVGETINKRTLIDGIIFPRVEEIFSLVRETLESRRLLSEIPAGLVLTGGGAETVGIAQLTKQIFRMPSRVAVPSELDGLTLDIHKPSFAASIGLLEHARTHSAGETTGGFSLADALRGLRLGGIGKKLASFVKSLLP